MFASRPHDPDTGLINMRARWYSPDIGRFLSPDPAGLVDGTNLYAYASNDPVNFFDPSGLARQATQDNPGLGFQLGLMASGSELPAIPDVGPGTGGLRIQGDGPFKRYIMEQLRELAPDAVLGEDGYVSMTRWQRLRARLFGDTGNRLVSSLVDSDRTITIVKGDQNAAGSVDWDATLRGESADVVVLISPEDSPLLPIRTPDGRVNLKGERPPGFIVLGHELIHAKHVIDGDYPLEELDNGQIIPELGGHTFIDLQGRQHSRPIVPVEELRTVGLSSEYGDYEGWFGPSENKLRHDHDLPPRGAYHDRYYPLDIVKEPKR